MPSANRMTTPVAVDRTEIEGRYAPLGEYTVSFETFKQDTDPAPYFVGLPDDRCQCRTGASSPPGQLTFRWPDHEETYVAGDAYYAPPGHLPLVTAGTSIVEFSPAAELEATMAVIERNLMAAPVMSARPGTAVVGADTSAVAADLIRFLETGTRTQGLFAPDLFSDLSLPQWRVQTATAGEIHRRARREAIRTPGRYASSASSKPVTASRSSSRSGGSKRARTGTAAR